MSKKSSKQVPPIEATLCDWSKRDFHKHLELLCQIVAQPRYICTKCGRVAGDKKWLCKARKIPRIKPPGKSDSGGEN